MCFIVKNKESKARFPQGIPGFLHGKSERFKMKERFKPPPTPYLYAEMSQPNYFSCSRCETKNLIIQNTRDGSCKNHHNPFVNLFISIKMPHHVKESNQLLRRTNRERNRPSVSKICTFCSCTV